MITFFNSETVYLGSDVKKFNQARDLLDSLGIKYKYSIKNRQGDWTGHGSVRGVTGSLNLNNELTYQYEILVHRKDYERVKGLI